MATTVARLQAVLSADTRDFDRGMKQSESRLRKVGTAAKLGVAVGVGAAVVVLKKSVDAALEAEKAETRLNSALKKVHASAKQRRAAQAAINKVSREGAIDDEDLSDVYANLVRTTGSVAKAQKGMALAADISRARNVDLKTAAKGVERVLLGQEGGLSRLGIKLGKNATATDVLRAAQEKFGGAAKDFGDSAAGAQERFQVSLENLQETIGKKLLPVLATMFEKLNQGVVWLERNWPTISEVIDQAWTQIRPVLEAFGNAVGVTVATIRKHWGTIGPILQDVFNIVKRVLGQIQNYIQLFADILRGDWGAAWDEVKQIVRNAFGLIKDLFILWKDTLGALAAGIAKAIWDGFKGALDAGWKAVKDKISDLFGKVIGWVKETLGIKSPSTVFYGIGQNLVRGFVNGIGSMGGLLKKAVTRMVKSLPGRVGRGLLNVPAGRAQGVNGLVPRVVGALAYARENGWRGTVTSGFRTYAEQARLYQNYLNGGPLAAPPGTSSHERGEAVDVTDYGTFGRIMSRLSSGVRLYNHLGARDPVHFSVSGYAKGGIVPGPIGSPQLAVVHGGETITPPGGEINLYVDGTKLFSWFRNAQQRYERRNG